MLANNNDYQEVFKWDNWKFYQPKNIADGYHHSRYVEAVNNEIYANAGCTRDVLKDVLGEMILKCNKELKSDTLRTDLAALANSLLYRLEYPVDQHCAIRQGAILLLAEITQKDGTLVTEDPNKVSYDWIEKKVKLALEVPEVYSFFLTTGVINLPTYKEVLNTLSEGDYFNNRMQAIKSLMPQSVVSKH